MRKERLFGLLYTKRKFYTKNFFSKCGKIHIFLWIWLILLKKSVIENSIFCVMGFFNTIFIFYSSITAPKADKICRNEILYYLVVLNYIKLEKVIFGNVFIVKTAEIIRKAILSQFIILS